MVLRQIPNDLFSFADIGLPDKIKELISRPRGLGFGDRADRFR